MLTVISGPLPTLPSGQPSSIKKDTHHIVLLTHYVSLTGHCVIVGKKAYGAHLKKKILEDKKIKSCHSRKRISDLTCQIIQDPGYLIDNMKRS